jgi:hypothetical protein
MPVLEAMAAGLPVVASACLGVQTFAQHGVNALLADPQACDTLCFPPCFSTPFCPSSLVAHPKRAACQQQRAERGTNSFI